MDGAPTDSFGMRGMGSFLAGTESGGELQQHRSRGCGQLGVQQGTTDHAFTSVPFLYQTLY